MKANYNGNDLKMYEIWIDASIFNAALGSKPSPSSSD